MWGLMDASGLIIPALTVLGSFIGAWLAARFALTRFYQEKLWERRTVAYTTIFEALYDMSVWFDTHYDAEIMKREIPKDQQDALYAEYKKARATLARRLAAEVWLIPDECKVRLDAMFKVLDTRRNTFFEELDHGSFEIGAATKDLARMVRQDLRVHVAKSESIIAKIFGPRRSPDSTK